MEPTKRLERAKAEKNFIVTVCRKSDEGWFGKLRRERRVDAPEQAVVDGVLSGGPLVFLICSFPSHFSSYYSQLASMMTDMGHPHGTAEPPTIVFSSDSPSGCTPIRSDWRRVAAQGL